MEALRLDRGKVNNWKKLPDGRLLVEGTFSTVGPLKYTDSDGNEWTEYLTSEELFREDSLETAGLAAVTLGHPEEGFVTPKNWKRFNVGATGSRVTAHRDAGLVDIVFVVGDEEAINAVEKDGLREVSAGYWAEIKTDGDRLYQTNRKYNHFALVTEGRAGPKVALHMDAVECPCAVQVDDEISGEIPMKKYKGHEVSDQLHSLIMDMEGEINALKEDMKQKKADAAHVSSLTEKLAKADAKTVALESEVEALKADAVDKVAPSEAAQSMAQWQSAFIKALPYLDSAEAIKPSDSVTAIYEKAIAAAKSDFQGKLDGAKTTHGDNYSTYVEALFDMLPEPQVKADAKPSDQRSDAYKEAIARATVGGDRDGTSLERADSDGEAQQRADSRKTYEERVANAWKGGCN